MQKIKAASIQFNHAPGDKAFNLERIRSFVEDATAQGVDLAVFPEMCITGYWHVRKLSRAEIESLAEPVPDGPSTGELRTLAAANDMTIGAGLIEITGAGELYNTYVVAMPDGRVESHRKIHCFISEHMSSGDDYTVFDMPQGVRVGVLAVRLGRQERERESEREPRESQERERTTGEPRERERAQGENGRMRDLTSETRGRER